MNGWLIDCYRSEKGLALWIKTEEGGHWCHRVPYQAVIYTDFDAVPDLKRAKINYQVVRQKTYTHSKFVLRIPVPVLAKFESFVRHIERLTRHRVTLYNCDIKPEQMFLYEQNLCPFQNVAIQDGRIIPTERISFPPLKELSIQVLPDLRVRQELRFPVRRLVCNEEVFQGSEAQVLKDFARWFHQFDPDVICAPRAYAVIPYLLSRFEAQGLAFQFDRWDARPLKYRGGRSYWSYNQVRYQDYSVTLRGRLLIDQSTFVGCECDTQAIMEMVELSGTLFQPTVARSFGAVFQSALVRLMVQEGMIIPYKEKPIEPPLSMLTMLKADRGGLTIDPQVGFHQHVAELDFVSMFPWLIYNHNISAECILSDEGPFEHVPDLPITSSLKNKGLIPRALKPFIDRRMFYKEHPSEINNRRARGLKWVLVSCYGYLRYREFKLGIPTSHMAICAYARETLLQCLRAAEDQGFNVIHGIVDSLYITKPAMSKRDVEEFRQHLQRLTGIPVACEGIFKWVVFLASRVDPHRALPATYFGVFQDGTIKARGIEVRQRGVPAVVKSLQESALHMMKEADTMEQIRAKIPQICAYARGLLSELTKLKPSLLVAVLKISKNDYKHNIPQKVILEKLKFRNIKVEPGESIQFIYSSQGPVLPEEYQGNPDRRIYQKLFVRALAVIAVPFGFHLSDIRELVVGERQLEINFDQEPGQQAPLTIKKDIVATAVFTGLTSKTSPSFP